MAYAAYHIIPFAFLFFRRFFLFAKEKKRQNVNLQ